MNFKVHFKRNLALAYPVMLSQAGIVMVGIVDNLMVGQLGATPLAAVSFASAIFFNIMVFGMGFAVGITPMVSAAFAQNNPQKAGRYFKNGLFLNLLIGVVLTLVMYGSTFAMPYLGQEPEVLEQAIPYFNYINLSMLPLMLFFHFKQFNEGLESTKPAMVISLSSNLLNIGLNWIFIYGHWGFEPMGLNGAGLATLISRIITGVLLAYYTLKTPYFRPFLDEVKNTRIRLDKCLEIIKVAIPISSQMLMEVMTFSIGAIMVGWIGSQAQAAHQIVIGMASLTYMVATGLSAAATIRVSNELGKNNLLEMHQSARTTMLMATGFMAITAVFFVLLKDWLPTLFVKPEETEVLLISSGLMIIAGIFQLFDGMQVVALGALRGIQDVKYPTLITMIAYWGLGLPSAYYFAFHTDAKTAGIWYGFLIGLGSASILLTLRFEWVVKYKLMKKVII